MSGEVEALINSLGLTQSMRGGVDAMMSRVDDFDSPLAALLAGVGVNEESRRHFDTLSDGEWGQFWTPRSNAVLDEVVVGSGPHALIYAAIRSAKGISVTILEKEERAGGSFACSEGPAFWLNSRNRPGPLGIPGEGIGLNVLPGVPLQPCMVGGGEYQTNYDLAWTIRANLMFLTRVKVHTGVRVKGIKRVSDRYALDVRGNLSRSEIKAKRVVFATGLGDPNKFYSGDTKPKRLLDFNEFMARMDTTFPLRDMDRVAVIGAGDSGKTVIEALLGQGPTTGMSVPELDFPNRIDWYGCGYNNQTDWCNENRGRYNRIGKALGDRIEPMPNANLLPTEGFESVQIGLRTYDWVINCTGCTGSVKATRDFGRANYEVNERVVARVVEVSNSITDQVYAIGPAAQIPIVGVEQRSVPEFSRIPENIASLFRYAPLTAAFANSLPRVDGAVVVTSPFRAEVA